MKDASLKARPRFLVPVYENEAGELEAAAGAAGVGLLAALTTVASVVAAAAGGVEVVVGSWMNSAPETGVELLDRELLGRALLGRALLDRAEEVAAGAKVSVTDEPADEAVNEGTANSEVVEAAGGCMPGGYSTPTVCPSGQSTVT